MFYRYHRRECIRDEAEILEVVMIIDMSLIEPSANEVKIADVEAARAAQDSFSPDIAELGYLLVDPTVSLLEDAKIVRMNIYDPVRKCRVGVAIRINRDGEITEGITIFTPKVRELR